MKKLALTAAQKKYAAACDACRAWAASVALEILRYTPNDRLAKSYGITPRDASSILSKACKERGL